MEQAREGKKIGQSNAGMGEKGWNTVHIFGQVTFIIRG
jgi:hypothetical protein